MVDIGLTRRAAVATGAGSAALLVLGGAPAHAGPALRAQRARAFVDSMGVQTHLSYVDTPYADVPAVANALTDLGIRHVRDELRLDRPDLYAALNTLAAAGVGSNLILGTPVDPAPSVFVSTLAGQVQGVETIEGTNEWDLAGGPWAASVYQRQAELYGAVRSEPRTASVPVLSPAMAFLAAIPELAAVGPLGAVADIGNVHEYGGGRPVTARLREALRKMRAYQRGQPVYVTETGYHNALRGPAGHPPVSTRVAATYVPRVFLDNFRGGIARTFMYELVDEFPEPGLKDPEDHFGLLNHDLSPKPAYRALRTLARLAEDRSTSFRPAPLRAALHGPRDLRRVVLQKSDGSHLLVLWRDVTIWNTRRRRAEKVHAVPVHLALPRRTPVRVYQLTAGGRPQLNTSARQINLSLGGDIVVVKVGGRSSRDFLRPLVD